MRVRHMMIALAAVVLAALGAGPAGAQEQQNERFTIREVEDGFLRVDRQTGEVLHCGRESGQWTCETLSGESSPSMNELARLKQENAALRDRVAALESRLKEQEEAKELPSDEELDRIFGFFQDMVRRFFDFARSFQNQPGEQV